MKLTTLLLITVILQVSATSFAQKISLSERNAPINKVFDQIRAQCGYDFLVTRTMIDEANLVTIKIKDEELTEALRKIFDGQPLDYTIEEKTVIVSQKHFKVPVNNNTVADLFTLSGKVVDETGKPLPGATINVQGPANFLVTSGLNGDFKIINAPAGAYMLTVTFIGYEKYATSLTLVTNNNDLIIRMRAVPKGLNEVVIVGYGSEKKIDLIGAVSHISADDIKNQPVNNVLSALQGMVPGLEIANTSGTPGAAVSVRIRGINSITSQRGALILIDGVPGDITTIPPADIESIDVLKDASSTAIYGARGSDGVIIIMTKRGHADQNRISINAYTGITRPTGIAQVLNTNQYRSLRMEGFKNDGVTPTASNAPDLFLDSTINTNWGKSLYHNAVTQDYQMNFSGGNTDLNYYISGGYRNENAVVQGNWFQNRANIRTGLDAKLFKGFSVGGGLAYTNADSRLYSSAVAATIYYALPMISYTDVSGNINLNSANPYLNPNRQLSIYNLSNSNQLLGNVYINYNIWDKLNFRTDVNYQYLDGKTTAFTPTTGYTASGTTNSGAFGYTGSKTLNIEPQLNYDHTIGKNYFKILAGATILNTSAYSTTINSATASNAIDDLNTVATGTVSSKFYTETPYKYASIFGRLNYKYSDRYLFEGVIRRDGSSRFGPNQQYGNFYSIGAGWIFSNEDFIENLVGNTFFGKLRANYGTTGNDNIGNFNYLTTSSTTTSSYAGNNTIYVSNLANPNIHWEVTKKFDFGADLNFLNGRIALAIDYYNNNTNGTLFSQGLSYVTGFSSITENLDGVVNNKGIEVSLNLVPVKNKDFVWNSNFNISTEKNKLVSLPQLSSASVINRYSYQVGQPVALIFGFKDLGVDPATGLAKFLDGDSNGVISSYTPDYQIIGKTIPDFYGGWTNSFTYKHFDLSVFIQFVSGVTKGYNIFSGIGNTFNLPVSALNRWQQPGDITDVPRAAAPGTAAYNNNSLISSSSFAYSDASYIRMKNITLGYTVKNLKKLHISSLRIYTTAYDQFTITGFKGDDPESSNNMVPMTKMITAGVTVTL